MNQQFIRRKILIAKVTAQIKMRQALEKFYGENTGRTDGNNANNQPDYGGNPNQAPPTGAPY